MYRTPIKGFEWATLLLVEQNEIDLVLIYSMKTHTQPSFPRLLLKMYRCVFKPTNC